VFLATALLRIRLLSMPLERDEGEYAYAGCRSPDTSAAACEHYHLRRTY
jgi:hypothetical protein